MNADTARAMDAEVATKVMGWHSLDRTRTWWKGGPGRGTRRHLSRFSTSMADAWQVVRHVQDVHKGWRFSLLGGDRTMGYESNPDGTLKQVDGRLVVVEDSRIAFGWKAEFFGELDPRGDYGDRHGEGWAESAPLAICIAALAAVERPMVSR